jgi:hypothetical protein
VASKSGSKASGRDYLILGVVTLAVVMGVAYAAITRQTRLAEASTLAAEQASVAAAESTATAVANQTSMPAINGTSIAFTGDSGSSFDEDAYIKMLENGLKSFTKRKINGVRIDDARATGGKRVVIVSYQTSETTAAGQANERLEILTAVSKIIKQNDLDIDSVTVVTDKAGNFAAEVKDLNRFDSGEITRNEIVKRITQESNVVSSTGITATVLVDALRVRLGPSTDYPVIGHLVRNEQVAPIGKNSKGTWVAITFKGRQGWVAAYTDIVQLSGDFKHLPVVSFE